MTDEQRQQALDMIARGIDRATIAAALDIAIADVPEPAPDAPPPIVERPPRKTDVDIIHAIMTAPREPREREVGILRGPRRGLRY